MSGSRLHVDDDFAAQIARGLGDAIGAGADVRAGHAGDAAEGSPRLRSASSSVATTTHRRHGRRSTTIDVLDHRPAHDIGEDFSGETRRVVYERDDGDDVLC
jgi:hypothetical protein